MEKRLIDADALFKEFERAAWYDNADRDEIAESILLQLPAVEAVEVVRCKDCVYNQKGSCTKSEEYDDANYRPDYFCADGERRTDE